jgi:hypothetical protein
VLSHAATASEALHNVPDQNLYRGSPDPVPAFLAPVPCLNGGFSQRTVGSKLPTIELHVLRRPRCDQKALFAGISLTIPLGSTASAVLIREQPSHAGVNDSIFRLNGGSSVELKQLVIP